jgi:acetoacetyl-CoA synthetase
MSSTAAETPLWTPSAERVEHATLTRFMRWLAAEQRPGVPAEGFSDYAELWRWSVSELESFWAAIWDFGGVRAHAPYEQVLASREMPGARWFPGAELNYAEHILSAGAPGDVAILHCSEIRPLRAITRGELADEVAAIAGGLRSLGVTTGDRVVAYLPNVPETLVAFLACASIGAIWSSAAPEFGARSVIDRFAQIEPKVLLTVDGYRYGGRDFDRMETLERLTDELPTVEHVVVLPLLEDAGVHTAGRPAAALSWAELHAAGQGEPLRFESLPFDHPLWVLYSSGTTGLPKAIVHGHGGILLEQLKKGLLHLDLHPGERIFWFTTTGWMMWNFLVGCLLTDAAIVMFDGNPAYPSLDRLWGLVEEAGITTFGTSAGFITACEREGVNPRSRHDLSSLTAVGSTGSVLPPEGFRWVYDHLGSDLWLFSTSGGTDVCTAFVSGCPLLPVYTGEIQCRALGCAVEAWDENGRSLEDEVGELVITEPMPSMPLGFWNDPEGTRYRESYFEMYPGVWRHGDWVRITPRGGAVIYGRSDSTINRQGVRMGTSEIYRAATAVPGVLDALVVDVPAPDGSLWMPLFVVLREGVSLSDELIAQVKRRIREDCSPRHVPDAVIQVAEVPRTLSGKLLEVPVKRILMGTPPEQAASIESLANPAALAPFVELAASRRGGA